MRFGGFVTVSVSFDGGKNWTGHDVHDEPLFSFVPPWTAAVSRRPYLTTDSVGEVLLRVTPAFSGRPPYRLSASYGAALLLDRQKIELDASNTATVPFPFRELDDNVHGYLNVTLFSTDSIAPVSSQMIKFQRAPVTQGQPVVALDYTRRALEVDGAAFLGFGWFSTSLYMTVAPHAIDYTIREMERFARLGSINMILPYNLPLAPLADRTRFLDAAEAVGVRVIMDLHGLVKAIVGGYDPEGRPRPPPANNTAIWGQLQAVVEAHKGHHGVLGWYTSDDTVFWDHDNLRRTYETIKAWDPFHPTFAAVAWAGNALNYKDCFDINMYENYPYPNDWSYPFQTSPPDADFFTRVASRYPMDWEPIWVCGQGFGTEDMRQLKIQSYLGFTAGLSGNLLFVSTPPSGSSRWQLRIASEIAGQEIQELLPSLLRRWSQPEPLVQVTPGCPDWVWRGDCVVAHGAHEASNGCIHVILMNKMNRPVDATIRLTDPLFTNLTVAAVPFEHRNATLISAEDGVSLIRESIGALESRVYAFGCAPKPGSKGGELVQNGGMEQVFYAGTAHGWDFLAPWESGETDDRVAAFADTRYAVSGRYSLRVVSPRVTMALGVPGLANLTVYQNPKGLTCSFYGRGRGDIEWGAVQETPVHDACLRNTTSCASIVGPTVFRRIGRQPFQLMPTWRRFHLNFTLDQGKVGGALAIRAVQPATFWLDNISCSMA